ncbi:MAG: hypothetical protein NWE94_08890 [Candidatus Bathyarchaeota archaeon]|nr:hypothetical protein [Candidatus Bathyarchaeota archaeon]
MKTTKSTTTLLLFLLTITTLLLTLSSSAYAQEEIPPEQYPQVPNPYNPPTPPPAPQETAIVVIAASVGGTTNLSPGAYRYGYGETITLQATADSGFKFQYWIIRGTYTPGHNVPPINYPENAAADSEWVPKFPSPSNVAMDSLIVSTNPLTVICGYGYTYVYEPVFVPTAAPPATNEAIVVVLNSIGGTTNPGPGTYYYTDGATISLKATPNSGYDFVYWVAVGADGHPVTFTDNPTSIICGYGYTYTYQAMFAPSGTAQPSGVPMEYIAAIVVLAIVAVIAIALAVMYRGKSKK